VPGGMGDADRDEVSPSFFDGGFLPSIRGGSGDSARVCGSVIALLRGSKVMTMFCLSISSRKLCQYHI
jgi:hypothetical protein